VETAPPADTATPRIAVHTVTVAPQDWPAVYEASGTVRARTAAVISSRVTGYVQQVTVQTGDRVAAGQTLVTLDARDLDAAWRRAEAARSEVESAIPEADSGVAAAKASLELARVTFQRMEKLYAEKSISNQEYDEASSRLKAAQASYEMARAKRTQLDARLQAAHQDTRAAAITRDYARIVAPFAGVVTEKSLEPGTLATTGAPLLTIERAGAYRLEAAVDETKLAAVRVGQIVHVALDTPECNVAAKVAEVVPAVDAASRSYIAKIDLPCAGLRSGAFGRALFPLGTRRVLAVPAAAILERGQIQSVFVVEKGVARTRLVTTGERAANGVEVLSGLSGGEAVVTPIPAGLTDGASVEAGQ
jgi:RND family efflux transporter MFP subunit